MTDHEEDQLRQYLSRAYPTEPAPPAFVERMTAAVASTDPSVSAPALPTTGSTHVRSWWIAAAAAAVVAVGVITIGLTAGPGAGPAATAGDPTGTATADTSAPVTVALPTSGWTSGNALAALAQGELVIGSDGCLHIDGTVLVWPQGFYGVETAPGTVEVYGPDGLPRVRTGENLAVGGGLVGADPAGCTSDGGSPFVIMDTGLVSGNLLPTDFGLVPEPSEGSTPTSAAGG